MSSQFKADGAVTGLPAMQVRHRVEVAPAAAELPDLSSPIPVFVAYRGQAAARWAMRVLGNVARALGDGSEFRPRLWPFDLLEGPDGQAGAASDAAQANLLILATDDADPLPIDVGDWVAGVLQQKQGSPTAIVALFGPEEDPEGAGSTRLEALRLAVRRAGLKFFAPEPGNGADPIGRTRTRRGSCAHRGDPFPPHQIPARLSASPPLP